MLALATVDVALVSTIGSVGVILIGAVVTGIIKIIGAIGKMRIEAAQAAAKATEQRQTATDEVKQTIVAAAEVSDKKTDDVKKIADSTHALVNGAHAASLQAVADLSSTIVDLTVGTDKHPAAVIASNAANLALDEHKSAINPQGTP